MQVAWSGQPGEFISQPASPRTTHTVLLFTRCKYKYKHKYKYKCQYKQKYKYTQKYKYKSASFTAPQTAHNEHCAESKTEEPQQRVRIFADCLLPAVLLQIQIQILIVKNNHCFLAESLNCNTIPIKPISHQLSSLLPVIQSWYRPVFRGIQMYISDGPWSSVIYLCCNIQCGELHTCVHYWPHTVQTPQKLMNALSPVYLVLAGTAYWNG